MIKGDDVRLSELDFDAFDTEDIDSLSGIYADVLERKPFDKSSKTDNTASCKCYSDAFPVFGVFDGMGGEKHGELASSLAREALAQRVKANSRDDNLLPNACHAANEAICKTMIDMKAGRMGTTAAMLHFSKDTVRICNIGDSRIYRYGGESLEQLSVDHAEDARDDTRKGGLTQHLGIFEHEMLIEPFLDTRAAIAGDRYLICSDGLTDMLDDSEIARLLKENKEAQQATDALIHAALERGGKDNITVIVCDIVKRILLRADQILCVSALLMAVIVGALFFWDYSIPIKAAFTSEDAAIGILAGESRGFGYSVDPPRKAKFVAVFIENEEIAHLDEGMIFALSAGTTRLVIADHGGIILAEREITVYAK